MFFRFLFLALVPFLLCACTGSPQRPADRDNEAKESEEFAIAMLVDQLGSSALREREAAAKALTEIGFPALPTLRTAAKSDDAEVARQAARLVETLEKSFDLLLADYRSYGLPLPPADAKLVRLDTGTTSYDKKNKPLPPTYFLGFLLQPATRDNPRLLLVGTQEVRLDAHTTVEIVEPKPSLVKRIDLGFNWMNFVSWQQWTFPMNAGLAIALQCKARGWNDLALELWTASRRQATGLPGGVFSQPANLSDRTAVSYLAWAHSGNELVKPDTDRARTARRMKALLAGEPGLNTKGNQVLLESLEATLQPGKGKPGTPEQLIDNLTEMCGVMRTYGTYGECDPRYTRLAQQGFAAVPALIEHLDDDRLTRGSRGGYMMCPPSNLRIKDVVSDLLYELAGEAVGKDWWQRHQSRSVEKADAQAWWARARLVGEEAYFLLHALPSNNENEWPNFLMLDIIKEKYPHHLPALYRRLLDTQPQVQSWPLAKAVAESSLPAEKKREVFLNAAEHPKLEHRRWGLDNIQKSDPEKFMSILLATLEALPRTPTEPYWRCAEKFFAAVVLATEDPKAWKMLTKVADRSDVGLRMEIMSSMGDGRVKGRQRELRLKFLASYLDDAEVRDVKAKPELFSGPYAAFGIARLSVRDFAAMRIASLLGMPEKPDEDWTPEQWEELRTRVKQALKR
jgi:hypothetical protein